MARSKVAAARAQRKKIKPADRIKLAEGKLEKKKKELLKVKALHKKIAGEFIDLWMIAKKLKRK